MPSITGCTTAGISPGLGAVATAGAFIAVALALGAGAAQAREVVVNFLIDLWAQSGIKPENTVLLGFSQGAMMALHVGLSLDEKLAGIVAISGALIPPPGLVEGSAPKTPVCILHGALDSVVDPALSEEAVATLTELGYAVSSHVAPDMGHGISEAMLDHALDFVRDKFA